MTVAQGAPDVSTRRLSLPFARWPEMDRTAWLAMMATRSILDEPSPGAHWSPVTKAGVNAAYARWLGWLALRDPQTLAFAPVERVTRDAVGAYASELRLSVGEATICVYLSYIAMAVRAMTPGADLAWLNRMTARPAGRTVAPGKKAARLVASRDLIELGIELMAQARASREGSERRRATRYRDGLMLALLAMRPLRLGNFVGIEIDRHLVNRAGTLWLTFDAAETKNRKPLDFPYPENLMDQLGHYLREVRPRLCAQTTGRNPRAVFQEAGMRLWISGTGAALRPKVFFTMTVRRTAEAFGERVNPHLFRDCLATTLEEDGYDGSWAIPHILGHKTVRTSERHYNHALGRRETETFQRHVESLRRVKLVGGA